MGRGIRKNPEKPFISWLILVSAVSLIGLFQNVFAAETPDERTARLMRFYDSNRDGVVDRGEYFSSHHFRFFRFDLNQDGFLACFEEAPIQQRGYCHAADRDGDGALSDREIMEIIEKDFREKDKNSNGVFETSEL